ncbi:hypothetical protein SALWKB29_0493 [Snodgrassella communis]|uniref:Uncharacterized protein n=1 Tax=Snodgrassella communis TaxID=2946699 RepID=A0A836MRQ9_9NEIS|nr:hypothetical protein SALWKB29_0493 [Snodgrassella communis]
MTRDLSIHDKAKRATVLVNSFMLSQSAIYTVCDETIS